MLLSEDSTKRDYDKLQGVHRKARAFEIKFRNLKSIRYVAVETGNCKDLWHWG